MVTDYAKDRRLCYTLAVAMSGFAAYTAYQTSQPKVGARRGALGDPPFLFLFFK